MGKSIPPIRLFLNFLLIFFLVETSFLYAANKGNRESSQDYRTKGYNAQQQGNLDMALAYYQRAIQEDHSYALAYNDIGVILESKGKNQDAKEAYLKAISLDPTLLSPYYNVAALYEKGEDLQNAAYYWEMRVNLGDWDDEWTWKAKEHLERIDGSLVEKGGQPINKKIDTKLKPDPKRDSKYHLFMGRKFIGQGDYVSAVRELNSALMFDPDNQEILDLLDDSVTKVNLYQ